MKKEIFDFSEALKRMRKGKLVKRKKMGFIRLVLTRKEYSIIMGIIYTRKKECSQRIFLQQTGRRCKDGEENIDPQRQQAMVRYDSIGREDRGVSSY